jgi:hypothetical protein
MFASADDQHVGLAPIRLIQHPEHDQAGFGPPELPSFSETMFARADRIEASAESSILVRRMG